MTRRELQERVSWTVEDPPPVARVAGLLGPVVSAVSAVVSFGSSTGAPSRATWNLPADPDAYVDIGLVRVAGDAPWLPHAGRRHRLRATQRAALVGDDRGRRPPTPVPLADLRITAARCRALGRSARHPHAPWTLTLTGPGAGTVDVDGAWLALAWIGHLAGWPEPAGG